MAELVDNDHLGPGEQESQDRGLAAQGLLLEPLQISERLGLHPDRRNHRRLNHVTGR